MSCSAGRGWPPPAPTGRYGSGTPHRGTTYVTARRGPLVLRATGVCDDRRRRIPRSILLDSCYGFDADLVRHGGSLAAENRRISVGLAEGRRLWSKRPRCRLLALTTAARRAGPREHGR
jgi:hypothetical protein